MLTRKAQLNKSLHKAWQAFAVRADNSIPVFIIGEMRSGTNSIMGCFERCPNADAYNEVDDEAFIDYELKPLNVIDDLIHKSKGTHVVFKSIADLNRADELLEYFPNARIVWIFRNFYDVVNSALKLWREHKEYLRLILEEPERARWRGYNLSKQSLELIRHYYYTDQLSEASARALIWYIRNNMYFERKLDQEKDRVKLVCYENIVTRPAQEVEKIFNDVGCQYRPAYSKHLHPKSIGKHQQAEIEPSILEMCDKLYDRLNKQLDSVQ